MKTYIALLRGINVGGHRKVPMADLRELFLKSGFQNVRTYIQSGNVIFKSTELNISKIESLITESILNHFGFNVPSIVKTKEQLQVIFNNCPFSQKQKAQSYFTLLSDIPNKELVIKLNEKVYPNETFYIVNNCIYFYSSVGYAKAKYSNNFFEKYLNLNATARNYKTIVKLLAMTS